MNCVDADPSGVLVLGEATVYPSACAHVVMTGGEASIALLFSVPQSSDIAAVYVAGLAAVLVPAMFGWAVGKVVSMIR